MHKNAMFLLVIVQILGRKEMTEAIEEQVKKLLEDVKPQLQADGGDINFVSMENGVVKVELKGACAGCPMSAMTVQWGVERYLKSRIPEVVRVEAVQ